jgi:hypothetical protein
MHANMYQLLTKANFCDGYGNAMKPGIVKTYSKDMRYVDNSD